MTYIQKIDPKAAVQVQTPLTSLATQDRLSVLVGDQMPLDRAATIPQLIAQQAKLHPDRTAACFGQDQITFQELDAQSEKLALEMIRKAHASKATFAALVLPNGLELIVALTAAMRARLPFVPIDPDWPKDRLDAVISALKTPVLVSTKAALPKFEARCDTLLMPFDNTKAQDHATLPKVRQKDLIYGFFTSGTTGTPKCALNLHRGLLNRVTVMTNRFGDPRGHVVLQNSKQVFDSSMWQILWPLSGGGTVVVPKRAAVFELDEVLDTIAEHGVTMSDFVPSVFNLMVERIERDASALEKIKSLKTLLLGGEEVNPRACARFKALMPHVQLINTYGPTEASIGSVFHEITGLEDMTVPIGRPIANTIAAVMDKKGNPVPIDTPGEIYVGGTCLGAGYLNNPEKTAASLAQITHPLVPTLVMYKTGDIGKLTPSGHLVYLGRQDFQVKINGVRIELTEIEGALTSHPKIKEAKAVAITPPQGGKRIVAFYTGDPLSAQTLRSWIQDVLPKGFVPSKLIHKDQMPRTPNAKIDRKRLVGEAEELFKPKTGTNSTTLSKAALKDIWRSHLGVEDIQSDSDFFKLGGDSLMALTLSLELAERFAVSIKSSDLYDHTEFDALFEFLADPNRHKAADTRRQKDQSKARKDAASLGKLPSVRRRNAQSPKNILVLGATGFIGAHVLAQLSERLAIPITAIVRGADDTAAKDRLRGTLKGYHLHRPGILDRVTVLAGDLGQSGFGIADKAMTAIQDDTDVVINCAAKVDFLAGYDGHQRVNTEMIKDLIGLCSTGRPKILHHLSSFAAIPKVEAGKLKDSDPLSAEHLPTDGYGLSKWAAEGLMDAAIEQGLSATVIRLGEIGASHMTGAGNQTAMLTYLMRGCLELGIYPKDVSAFDYTSVDCVCAMITELVMDPGIQGRRFHLLEPSTVTMKDFGRAGSRAGLKLAPVSYKQFFRVVSAAVSSETASGAIKRLAALLPEPKPDATEHILMSDCTKRCATSDRIVPASHIADDTKGFREKALGRFLQSLTTT